MEKPNAHATGRETIFIKMILIFKLFMHGVDGFSKAYNLIYLLPTGNNHHMEK